MPNEPLKSPSCAKYSAERKKKQASKPFWSYRNRAYYNSDITMGLSKKDARTREQKAAVKAGTAVPTTAGGVVKKAEKAKIQCTVCKAELIASMPVVLREYVLLDIMPCLQIIRADIVPLHKATPTNTQRASLKNASQERRLPHRATTDLPRVADGG
jgi:hypothetical protein